MKTSAGIKKIIVYSLLYLYVFAQVKPLLPAIKDAVAHTFFKMEHLATVHYENGKYHLHTELQKEADEQNDPGKKNVSASSYETVSIHEQCAEIKINVFTSQIFETISYPVSHPAEVYPDAFNPPPEAYKH